MRTIPQDVVAALISLGCNGVPDIPECLSDEDVAWDALVRTDRDHWRKLAKTIPEYELRHLIQGIVLYSQARRRGVGGSASPVIVLYHSYVERFPAQEPTLTGWIVNNRVNDFDPFGRVCSRAVRTYAEFLEFVRCSELEAEAREKARVDEIAKLKQQRQVRDAVKATSNLANAVRRGDLQAVTALLGKGADPTTAFAEGGSLVALAEASGRVEVAAYLRSQGIG